MNSLAKLTDVQLNEIRKFEKEWNDIVLLAYQKPAEPAQLSLEQMQKIRNLEKELGIILVAYK
jgi:hypothetical protein